MINVEQKVKDFLRNELEDDRGVILWDTEAERLVEMIERALIHSDNVGVSPYLKRLEHNPREKAFHDVWLEWNEARAGHNQGQGILQDLFIDDNPQSKGLTKIWHEVINSRDRRIVATIIQWLGTNVGIGFLSEALKRGGQYKLESI